MKAAVVRSPGGLDKLELVEREDPGPPGAGEIRVRVRASSLNYHDYSVANGTIPSDDCRILLSDCAGDVEEVGAGVSEFREGDRVVSCFFPHWLDGPPDTSDFRRVPGDGIEGYACEYTVRPAHFFVHAPSNYDYASAATLTCAGLTAWRALVVDGALKAGDTVLLLGTGGVSIFGLAIAKAMGARVAITSSSDTKLVRARGLGADFTVNYTTEPKWGQAVLDWTGGRGVDHVVEVGGPATLPESIRAARVGGHIALIGVLTGIKGAIPTATLMRKQIRLQGLIVGSRADHRALNRAIEVTGIRPVIDARFPLSNLVDAFRHEERGAHFGKICIDV